MPEVGVEAVGDQFLQQIAYLHVERVIPPRHLGSPLARDLADDDLPRPDAFPDTSAGSRLNLRWA